ncbi:MAG TPA: UvrD-helicase domain-containing protein [Candidatus Obscuribacter sp.]|nr:UvrD-helicase domain-containing protein [Candidatus Obscuribacter sp.]HNB13808.1 UvrD-helicase domain-containing protein [Candidatus Obscuribacter sp.]HND04287.1 UvrD-helicase domain-containing protein [Candidatus Obscuribacter sp.]HND65183.1 UvrD-helicase domain-containing protein [Candidatus Obscuribacter sp.]HNG74063.1 UvrD-helicase domain-containing protein [Candidatus Obscuribacter sp.]
MLTSEQIVAVNTVEENVLVSAGAGSGKTHVLVERYVEILRRNEEISLANIIAVTFTRKAAAEMRSRLKSKFLSLSRDAAEIAGGYSERWRKTMLEVDGARIGTIHSLCESILKAFPGDCGIDPQFLVLDELKTSEMLSSSVEHAIRTVIGAEPGSAAAGAVPLPALDDALLVLNEFSIDELRKLLSGMIRSSMQLKQTLAAVWAACGSPAQADQFSMVPPQASLKAAAQAVMNQVREQASQSLLQDPELKRALLWLSNNPHSDPKNGLEAVRLEVLSQFEEAGRGPAALTWQAFQAIAACGLKAGGNKPESKELREGLKSVRERIKAVVEKLPPSLLPEDERGFACARGLLQLFQIAYEYYGEEKAKLTALDYNDLIDQTIRALSQPQSRARLYFHERLRALLVDEFQDTNDVQARLLSLMAGPDTRLFLIGDDKQSIYKFQGADVATFNKWKSSLEDGVLDFTGASLVTKLTSSFRSHPEVVDFVNAVFYRLFDRDPRVLPYVAAFEALSPARQAGATSSLESEEESRVEVILHEKPEEDPTSQDVYEARLVADWILDKLARGVTLTDKSGAQRPLAFGDFAVLVQRNRDFAQFEQVFASLGIPFVVFGGSGFLRRQEVLDFESLLRFLDKPQDSHSLLAVLRSPFCALSDDLIHRIGAAGDGPLYARLQTMAAGSAPPAVAKAAQLLRRLLDEAALLPLSELVHKIVSGTGYELAMLAAPDGRQRSRNVWKLVHLACQDDHLSCGEFADKLSAMREFNMRESEAPLDSGDSVKLMTVHASKGLEFAAVALPCLGAAALQNSARSIFHPGYGIAFNTKRLEEEEIPAWYQVAGYLDRQMEWEERKRLLYVAMTRARDFLALFMKAEGRKVQSYRTMLRTVLSLDGDHTVLPEPGSALRLSLPFSSALVPYSLRFAQSARRSARVAPELQLAKPSDLLLAPLPVHIEYPKVNELGLSRITSPAATKDALLSPLSAGPELFSPSFLGVFFHALMENLPTYSKADAAALYVYVRDIASTQSFHMAHGPKLERLVTEGLRLLDIYFESRLHQLLSTASRRYNEAEYSLFHGDDLIKRRPDLIFQTFDGDWYLVDFKTDHAAGEVEMRARAGRHSVQLNNYRAELSRLSGLSLTAHIYFAQTGILFPV